MLNAQTFVALKYPSSLNINPNGAYLSWLSSNGFMRTLPINEDAFNIIKNLQGHKTIQEIACDLTTSQQLLPNSIQQVIEIIIKFLELLEQKKYTLIKKNHPFQGEKLHLRGQKEKFIPLHWPLEITKQCNMACMHCYGSFSPQSKHKMELVQFKTLTDELLAMGANSIELTGGEPFTHPEIEQILLHSLQSDFWLISILSNGVLIEKQIPILQQYRQKVAVQLDLHGADSDYLQWFTQYPNALEQQLKAIKMVSEIKPLILRVTSNITPSSIPQMEKIADLALAAGAESIGFSPIVPLGRGQKNKDILFNSPCDIEAFFKQAQYLKKKYGQRIIATAKDLTPFTHQKGDSFQNENKLNCGAGHRSLLITPQSEIKLCQMHLEPLPVLADLTELSLSEFISHFPSDFFAQLPAPSAADCLNCADLHFCEGCVVRGLLKNKERKEDCLWYKKHLILNPQSKILSV